MFISTLLVFSHKFPKFQKADTLALFISLHPLLQHAQPLIVIQYIVVDWMNYPHHGRFIVPISQMKKLVCIKQQILNT